MRGRSEERTGPSPGRGQIPTGNPPPALQGFSCCTCSLPSKFLAARKAPAARAEGPGSQPHLAPTNPASQFRHRPVCGWQVSPWRQWRGHGCVQFSPYSPRGHGCRQWIPFQPGSQARQAPSTGEQGCRFLQWPQLQGQERKSTGGTQAAQRPASLLFPRPALGRQRAHLAPLSHRLLTCGHTGVRKCPSGRALCSWGLCSQHHRCSVHPEVRTGRAHTGTGAGRLAPTTLLCIRIAQTPGHKAIRGSCRERRIACPTSPDGRGSGRWPDHSGSPRDCTGIASDSQGPTSLDHTGRCL